MQVSCSLTLFVVSYANGNRATEDFTETDASCDSALYQCASTI